MSCGHKKKKKGVKKWQKELREYQKDINDLSLYAQGLDKENWTLKYGKK